MIKVAVVDNEKLVRAGICTVLGSSGKIDVVAQADDGHRALALARQHRPDVMVMDVRISGMDGIRATQAVRREVPTTQVLILAAIAPEEHVYLALRAGAAGFLVKDVDPGELISAVLAVAAGDSILSPSVTRCVVDQFRKVDRDREKRARERVESLSAREFEVLGHLAKGMGNSKIAQLLYLSEGAIKAHISHFLTKLGCANRVQAAIIAHDSGLFE